MIFISLSHIINQLILIQLIFLIFVKKNYNNINYLNLLY